MTTLSVPFATALDNLSDAKKDSEHGTASSSSKGKGVAGGRAEKSKQDYSSGVQEAERNKLVFFEGCSYNFDLEDLLRASAEVLGKGSYGTTYKAVLEDGMIVVVKRPKEVAAGKRDFEHQMEIIDRVSQHQSVVPLRASYYSKDEKLLVYDYVPPGSLSAALHGCWKKSTGLGGKSEDIKSSNILLSQELSACVSEFGLAQIMATPHVSSRLIGYCAPEVLETKKTTQKSDVYSFGVILLEMLTGKAPLRSPGREGSIEHLPRWVQSVVREEWTSEVRGFRRPGTVDVDLLRDPNTEDEMIQMLQIAMACVAIPPDQRPRMEEVVKRIEEIRSSCSETRRTSPEDKPEEESIHIIQRKDSEHGTTYKRKKDSEHGTASSSSKGKGVAGGRAEKSKQDYSSGVQEAEKSKQD